jgi:hypothetical protein
VQQVPDVNGRVGLFDAVLAQVNTLHVFCFCLKNGVGVSLYTPHMHVCMPRALSVEWRELT